MAEYIEREAVVAGIEKRVKNPVIIRWLGGIISDQPAADVAPVVQTPCDFCSKWDWGEAAAVVDLGKYAHIHLAGGSYRFPADKQFNFCPVCGYQNPYKGRKDGEDDGKNETN